MNGASVASAGFGNSISALSAKQIAHLATTNELTLAQWNEIMAMSGLTAEKEKACWAEIQQTGVESAATKVTLANAAAKGVNETATWSLSKAMKGLWLSNPYLVVIAAVTAGLWAIVKVSDALTVTFEEQKEITDDLISQYNTLDGEIQSLEGELETTQQRINELQNGGPLSFVEQEELSRLRLQNKRLGDELELRKKLAEYKVNEVNNSVKEEYQKGYVDSTILVDSDKTIGEAIADGTIPNTSRMTVDPNTYIKRQINKIEQVDYWSKKAKEFTEFLNLDVDFSSLTEEEAIAAEKQIEDAKAKLEDANKHLMTLAGDWQSLADRVEDPEGAGSEMYQEYMGYALDAMHAANGDFWSSKATDGFNQIWDDKKYDKAKAGLQELAKEGKVTAEVLGEDEYSGFVNGLTELGVVGGETGLTLDDLAAHINSLGEKVDGPTSGTNSLKTALASLSDETTALQTAMSKLGSGTSSFDQWIGSTKNLNALLDKFPDLRDELEAYSEGLIDVADLQRAFNAALQDFNANQVYEGVNKVVDAFNNHGAGSNQVLQAVQNLEQYIPGLTAQLYSQDNAFSLLDGTTQLTADAFYEYCAAAIEAERISREINISNLTTNLSDLAAMAMTAGHSMKESMGLAKADIADRSGESFGTDDSLAKLSEWYETSMANLESARSRWSRSQSTKNVSEVYVPDVDPLYQHLQAVEDINDELNRIDIDEKLLDEDDFEGKNALIERRIQKLEELKTALHELNNARDTEISEAVDKLNGYGDFQATYDKESGQAVIHNMDALKGLTGDTAKAAEALISTIEDGSKAAISTSNEYMEALIEQNELLKEQQELQKSAADDRIERLRNSISLSANQQKEHEGNLDHQAAIRSLNEQKGYWVQMQDIAHQMAEDIRAANPGITDDDPRLKEWIDLWWEGAKAIDEANQTIVDTTLGRYNDFISKADDFNWWDNIDTNKVDTLRKKLETIHQLYKDGVIPDAAAYKQLVNETAKSIYNEQMTAINTIIEKTKELIKKEVELRVQELEEQVDDYKKIVDLKKESLRASKDEADYQKSVAEKTRAIAQLQQQINTLSLSNDRRDIAERKKLEEELADLQGELTDTQADHTIEAQEKALDDSCTAFEQSKQDEIKVVQATIDTEGKLYALAIDRIDQDWDALYSDLMQMNSLYFDGIAGEAGIKGAWEIASDAASGYLGILQTIQGVEKEYNSASGGHNTVGSTTAINLDNYSQDTQKEVQAKLAEMQANSDEWHIANTNRRKVLEDRNRELADQIEALTRLTLYRDHNGVWRLDGDAGDMLYPRYHTGGMVGERASSYGSPWDLAPDEVHAILQRGEYVLSKADVKPAFRLISFADTLAGKMRGLFSGDSLVSSAMESAIRDSFPLPAASAVVNNNGISMDNMKIEVHLNGAFDNPEEAGRAVGKSAVAEIMSTFGASGVFCSSPLLAGIQ